MIQRRPAAPIYPESASLIALAAALHAMGLTPSYGRGDHGNLSCRVSEGILITGRETSKAALAAHDLAHIIGTEPHHERVTVITEGAVLPSTDTLMHLQIYTQRPDCQAIVHGHDPQVLQQAEAFGLPVTRTSAVANSLALVEEVRLLSASHDYIILRAHGFIALGASFDEARERLLHWFHRARAH